MTSGSGRLTITFRNIGELDLQLVVVRPTEATARFTIRSGESDSLEEIQDGEELTFFWRDDGDPPSICEDQNCNPNVITLANSNGNVTLPDPYNRWAKQTI